MPDLYNQPRTEQDKWQDNSKRIKLTKCSPWRLSTSPERMLVRAVFVLKKLHNALRRQLSEIEPSEDFGLELKTVHGWMYRHGRRHYNFSDSGCDQKMRETWNCRRWSWQGSVRISPRPLLLSTPALWIEKHIRGVSTSDTCLTHEIQVTSRPCIYRLSCNIFMNAKKPFRPWLNSFDVTTRRKYDIQVEGMWVLYQQHDCLGQTIRTSGLAISTGTIYTKRRL